MQEILRTELAGEYSEGAQKDVERLQDDTAQGEKGKTLVMGELFLSPVTL